RIRLRELRVGDNFARDVIASVAPGLNHPLLGQSFLKRFASVTLDNQRRVLILSGPGMANSGWAYSGSSTAPPYPSTVAPSPYYSSPSTGSYSPYNQPSYWTPMR